MRLGSIVAACIAGGFIFALVSMAYMFYVAMERNRCVWTAYDSEYCAMIEWHNQNIQNIFGGIDQFKRDLLTGRIFR